MNWYFYKYFLPYIFIFCATVVAAALGKIQLYWGIIFMSWVLIGPVGIGVGFHRLFSHRQFTTYRWVEVLLAVLGTLAGYAPLLFWVANHQYHHKFSDSEQDPSSPEQMGFWESFLWYRLKAKTLNKVDLNNYCTRQVIKDRFLRHISRRFLYYAWIPVGVVFAISPSWAASIFVIPIFLEHLRTNVVSSFSHMKTWFSYRNFATADNSQNDLLIGVLSFGFGWHNNHHQNPKQCNLRVKPWEIDLEYLICRLIAKSMPKYAELGVTVPPRAAQPRLQAETVGLLDRPN